MYNLTLTSKGNDLYLGYYTEPEPELTTSMTNEENIMSMDLYRKSKKEVKVHEDSIDDFIVALGYVPINDITFYSFWNKCKKDGIPCDILKERIEIKCSGCDWDLFKPLSQKSIACCPDSKYFAFLKPSKELEETQMDIDVDLIQSFDKWDKEGRGLVAFNKIVKTKFNITRK